MGRMVYTDLLGSLKIVWPRHPMRDDRTLQGHYRKAFPDSLLDFGGDVYSRPRSRLAGKERQETLRKALGWWEWKTLRAQAFCPCFAMNGGMQVNIIAKDIVWKVFDEGCKHDHVLESLNVTNLTPTPEMRQILFRSFSTGQKMRRDPWYAAPPSTAASILRPIHCDLEIPSSTITNHVFYYNPKTREIITLFSNQRLAACSSLWKQSDKAKNNYRDRSGEITIPKQAPRRFQLEETGKLHSKSGAVCQQDHEKFYACMPSEFACSWGDWSCNFWLPINQGSIVCPLRPNIRKNRIFNVIKQAWCTGMSLNTDWLSVSLFSRINWFTRSSGSKRCGTSRRRSCYRWWVSIFRQWKLLGFSSGSIIFGHVFQHMACPGPMIFQSNSNEWPSGLQNIDWSGVEWCGALNMFQKQSYSDCSQYAWTSERSSHTSQ